MHSMKGACNCSTPILREMFAEFFNEECDGAEHTLIETAVRPMDRVFAELGNFSDCPVKYRFLSTDGKTVTHVVPPFQIQAFQIPGRIIMVTLTCAAALNQIKTLIHGKPVSFQIDGASQIFHSRNNANDSTSPEYVIRQTG